MGARGSRDTVESSQEATSRLPLIAITAVLLVVGCSLSYVLFWDELSSQIETDDWVGAQGVVISSGIESERSCDYDSEGGCSTTHQPFAEYQYDLDGVSYEGTRISYTWENTFIGFHSLAESVIDDFQEGEEVTVYVNPDDHDESVLIQGIELKSMSFPIAILLPLVLASQPIQFILMVNYAKRRNSDNTSAPVGKGNWIGPDGTESGPGVAEDWYMRYDGPAPIVEDIYEENYAVDRGNGVVPIDFYIKKWGIPEGFGNTGHEINAERRSRN